MTSIKTTATRVLTDSELDTVAGGAAATCSPDCIPGKILSDSPPAPPPPTWSGWPIGW
jgi:hypothetical protein